MVNFDRFNIILFSASPRRAELLTALGLDFTVAVGGGDESFSADLTPVEIVKFIAEKKSKNFQNSLNFHDILITADTIVVVDNQILGKPADKNEAISMLNLLSGREHSVMTAYTIRTCDKFISNCCETKVRFRNLTPLQIEYYVDNYKPYDKAGAYGIQEWIGCVGIEAIEGSYYNVMGLPVDALYHDLLNVINN